MGTTQKFFSSIFGKKGSKTATVKYTPDQLPVKREHLKRATAKNNRKRTPGRKFHYQVVGGKTILHRENEVY
jgi:hypothetical protein